MNTPNILVFMTDQQRGDTIYPYQKAKTPNIDGFCKEGLTFSNAYTVSPHCCPARASFFTGLYPSQHGVWNNVDVSNTLSKGLYKGVRLFSEDLKKAGYQTYYGGKWHVSSIESPLDRGFDETNISYNKKKEYKHQKPCGSEWKKYEDFIQRKDRKKGEIIRKGYTEYVHYGIDEDPFTDRKVVDDAIKKIKSRNETGTPWFQFVGTLGPHDPYFVPERFLEMYNIDDIKLPDNFSDKMLDKPSLYRRTRERFDQLSEVEHKEAIRNYLAFCSYEDELFGEVLKALEESGEKDNTLVIYTSDHGDYMSEHGLWCKGLPCFKSAYQIPAVISWPKGIKDKGRVIEEFVSIADFAPTILELANIDQNVEMIGKSLVPFIKNTSPKEWREVLYTQSNGNELYGIQRSVMTKDWKFVYNGFDYDELYDIKNDPGETINVNNNIENDNIIKELSKLMWKFAKDTDDVCINPYIMISLAKYGPGVIFEKNV